MIAYNFLSILFLSSLVVSDSIYSYFESELRKQISEYPENIPPPPPVKDAARMARYIVHYTDWCSLAHFTFYNETKNYPLSRVYSISDGYPGTSTGIPYMYAPLIDDGIQDLMHDNRCSMTMSLAQGSYCKNNDLDPEDPRCPQVILTGNCVVVQNGTEEYDFAQKAVFTRHPIMKHWPIAHGFMFIKPVIKSIMVVDDFGGNKRPSVTDYFNSPPKTLDNEMETIYTQETIGVRLI